MGLPVTKVKKNEPYPADGFTETTEYTILHCADVDGNANKYYALELQTNPSTGEFRLYSEYGRLGHPSPARDLRLNISESEARTEFAKIIKSKKRPKTKTRKLAGGDEKHVEQYREVDVAAPTVGSPNICASGSGDGGGVTATIKSKGTLNAALFSNMGYQQSVQSLLVDLHRENVHNIESNTNVTVTSNGLETPLGPVTHTHIGTARDCLNRLQAIDPNARVASDRQVRDMNSEFFSLIPQTMGNKITDADLLLTDDDLGTKFDLLQGMEAALTVTVDSDEEEGKKPSLGLGMTEIVSRDDAYKALAHQVHSTMKHGDVRGWRVNRIFEVTNDAERAKFRNPVRGAPEYDLFHGSGNANLLSIMLKGFYVPPSSSSQVTGRMFGNGVYGASSSSKAFRYSVGLWGGSRSRMPTAYMFLVKFAMGKIYETHSATFSGAPRGYHSTWAKAGSSLRNDEFIVYDTRQTMVSHLIEMKQ